MALDWRVVRHHLNLTIPRDVQVHLLRLRGIRLERLRRELLAERRSDTSHHGGARRSGEREGAGGEGGGRSLRAHTRWNRHQIRRQTTRKRERRSRRGVSRRSDGSGGSVAAESAERGELRERWHEHGRAGRDLRSLAARRRRIALRLQLLCMASLWRRPSGPARQLQRLLVGLELALELVALLLA